MTIVLGEANLVALQAVFKKDLPSFEVAFKDQSAVMKVLGLLAHPFNPDFLTKYVTTWGGRVYFPSKEFFLEDPASSFRILAHEYVHLWDAKNHKTFNFTYLFPQVLVVLPLLAYVFLAWPHGWIALLPFISYFLACLSGGVSRILFWAVLPCLLCCTALLSWWLTGWASLTLLGTLVFLAPWPAPWRAHWELRGYGMNVAIAQWVYGGFTRGHRESIIRQFVGPAYFYMSWSRSDVSCDLDLFCTRARLGDLQKEPPFDRVFSLLDKS
jgi:hypothetical protein